MKTLLVVGDGMADLPIKALNGKTPLESLDLPAMARVAGGELGRIRTCPEGLAPGSDVAFLTLLGNDAKACYTGRSPLEAAGEGVELQSGEASLRVNLITDRGGLMASYNGGGVGGEDAKALASALCEDAVFAGDMAKAGMRLVPTSSFRHIAVLPDSGEPFGLTPAHDISGEPLKDHLPTGQHAALLTRLQTRAREVLEKHPVNARREASGLEPANGIWFWGAGTRTALDSFAEKYGVRGVAATAVPLVRGIARLCGLRAPVIPGATGDLDTNYEGKLRLVLDSLAEGDDFALVHLEAPDDMSHLGSLPDKLEAIRRLETRVLEPLLCEMDARGERYRVLLMPDHYTLLSTRTHDGTPVPYAIYDSLSHGEARPFCEKTCTSLPILESGDELMRRLFWR